MLKVETCWIYYDPVDAEAASKNDCHLGKIKRTVKLIAIIDRHLIPVGRGVAKKTRAGLTIIFFNDYNLFYSSVRYANVASTLNSRDLLNIALDVSKGMRHVASKKLVHRDLAARNVLMSKDLVAKIGDFGLARDVYSEGIYVKTGGGRLPIKWMAPESIKDRAYTIKSDVWSFGILLWEIVTLGGSPYPSMPVNILLEKLLYGYRMLKPDHCSDEVYSIMEECWSSDPVTRPSFDFLCKELLTLLSEEGRTYINVKGLALDESDSELSNEQGNFSCNL